MPDTCEEAVANVKRGGSDAFKGFVNFLAGAASVPLAVVSGGDIEVAAPCEGPGLGASFLVGEVTFVAEAAIGSVAAPPYVATAASSGGPTLAGAGAGGGTIAITTGGGGVAVTGVRVVTGVGTAGILLASSDSGQSGGQDRDPSDRMGDQSRANKQADVVGREAEKQIKELTGKDVKIDPKRFHDLVSGDEPLTSQGDGGIRGDFLWVNCVRISSSVSSPH